MEKTNIAHLIKTIYFYLVSFTTLVILIINTGSLVNSLLKTFVFTQADEYYRVATPACDPIAIAENDKIEPLSEEQCAKIEEKNREEQERNRISELQRGVSQNISFIAVTLPLFLLHWLAIRKKT